MRTLITFYLSIWLSSLIQHCICNVDAAPFEFQAFYESYKLDSQFNAGNRQIAPGLKAGASFDEFVEHIANKKTSDYNYQRGKITGTESIDDIAKIWKQNGFRVQYVKDDVFIKAPNAEWGVKTPNGKDKFAHGEVMRWMMEKVNECRAKDQAGVNEPGDNDAGRKPIGRIRQAMERIHDIRIQGLAGGLLPRLQKDLPSWSNYFVISKAKSLDKEYEVIDTTKTMDAGKNDPKLTNQKKLDQLTKLADRIFSERDPGKETDMHWRAVNQIADARGLVEAPKPC